MVHDRRGTLARREGRDAVEAGGRSVLLAAAAVALAACSSEPARSPGWERGRQVFVGQCAVCHGPEPGRPGPVGPAVAGASPALLEAKVVRGAYPTGHTPARPTRLMQPMPELAGDIGALAEYLRQP